MLAEEEQRAVAAAAKEAKNKEGYQAVESLATKLARMKEETERSQQEVSRIRAAREGYDAVEQLDSKISKLKGFFFFLQFASCALLIILCAS